MGELGLKPVEFYHMTWADYQRASLGYRIRLDRGWDYTRHIMAASLGAMSTKRIRPSELIPCIFDQSVEIDPLTPEEWQMMKTAWKIGQA